MRPAIHQLEKDKYPFYYTDIRKSIIDLPDQKKKPSTDSSFITQVSDFKEHHTMTK